MNNFQKLHDAGAVKRWHTWPTIKEQDVAAHSWGVAMVVARIDPGNDAVIKAALTHDLHEVESGDIPYPAKKRYPAIGKSVDEQEKSFNEQHDIDVLWNTHDKRVLKWADMFELLLFAKRELEMGNLKMSKTMDVAKDALRELGFPTREAMELYKEIIG